MQNAEDNLTKTVAYAVVLALLGYAALRIPEMQGIYAVASLEVLARGFWLAPIWQFQKRWIEWKYFRETERPASMLILGVVKLVVGGVVVGLLSDGWLSRAGFSAAGLAVLGYAVVFGLGLFGFFQELNRWGVLRRE